MEFLSPEQQRYQSMKRKPRTIPIVIDELWSTPIKIDDIPKVFERATSLIAVGLNNGAYADISAGSGYAHRILEAMERIQPLVDVIPALESAFNRLLSAANDMDHGYLTPSIDEAEDVSEKIRYTKTT